jgi:hypothetical protein
LEKVAANARQVAAALDGAAGIPATVLFQPVIKSAEEATALCQRANADASCAGLITWCHTFSPSKMWINGLRLLRKPLLHFHTQHNRDIPWATIDMDFMNLNQAAHGDREHGFIMSRMRLNRKVVVGVLARSGGAGADRRLDPRGGGVARLAGGQVLPLRRQHARGGGDRGRQGGGANSIRLFGQRLWRGRFGRARFSK